MPAGSLIQLQTAYAAQSIYLIANPQITFFKLVSMRHTNFASEYIREEFTTRPNMDPAHFTKLSVDIERNGDLMSDTYFVIDLPNIYSSSVDNFKWIDNIGNHIIKKAEIFIGGSLIDRHYGQWMEIWSELSYSDTKHKAYSRLIDFDDDDDIPVIYYGNLENGNSNINSDLLLGANFPETSSSFTPPSIRKKRLYVPLQFWFCTNPGLAIPLISLQYTTVRIDIEVERFNNLFTIGPYDLSPEAFFQTKNQSIISNETKNEDCDIDNVIDFLCSDEDHNPRECIYNQIVYNVGIESSIGTPEPVKQKWCCGSTNNIITPRIDVSDATPWCSSNIFWKYVNGTRAPRGWSQNTFLEINYIFLDTDERTKFAYSTNEYIIPQIQRYETTGLRESQIVELNFQHPVEELIWVFQRDDANFHNDWSNFTNFKYYKDYKELKNRLENSKQLFSSDNTAFFLQKILDNITTTPPGATSITLENVSTYEKYLETYIMPSILPSGIKVDQFLVDINTSDPYCSTKKNIDSFDELFNIMYELKIKFNAQDRIQTKDSFFFDALESFKYHTNSVKGIYKYSFALNPEDMAPSGHVNLSRIDKVEFEFLLREPPRIPLCNVEPPKPYARHKYLYNMYVYARSFNILRIMNGIGSTVFAN
jgi:hypothetical protein